MKSVLEVAMMILFLIFAFNLHPRRAARVSPKIQTQAVQQAESSVAKIDFQ